MEKEFLEIISFYGLKNQLKKLSEEIYELQEAILLDEGGEESYQHICEERADVEILLRQLDQYFDLKFSDVSSWIVKKINKIEGKIADEEC